MKSMSESALEGHGGKVAAKGFDAETGCARRRPLGELAGISRSEPGIRLVTCALPSVRLLYDGPLGGALGISLGRPVFLKFPPIPSRRASGGCRKAWLQQLVAAEVVPVGDSFRSLDLPLRLSMEA